MTTALDVQDLCFGYGRGQVVQDVSLRLQAGDCYGFLGHNGAGKTTVMRLCLGLLRPRRGSVRLLGMDALRSPRLARAGVGALVERPGFHAAATAHANLCWLAQLQGLPRRLAGAESARVLDRLGLLDAAGRRVGTFSLGMRQRLGVAAAMLGKPRLLLLDEPTNGLDPEGIVELRALLHQLTRDEGVAVFLSSHQLQEVEGLCTRIGVLRQGRMVVEGDVEALRRGMRARHVVVGTPLAAMAERLRGLGLVPEVAGPRLTVDLLGQAPGAVARALTAVGEVAAFAPEPVTLEAIYLRATQAPPAVVPAGVVFPAAPTAAAEGLAADPRRRAFAHECRILFARRSTAVLLLVPAITAVWSVVAYRRRVELGLARVRAAEVFSADAGSGHLGIAHALQAALPVLGLALLWLSSQSVAADLARDTLRNTLVRSVSRFDVLLGKFGALCVAALVGGGTLLVTAVAAAALLFGLGDLSEVTRHGDRQVLAAAADVAPAFAAALAHCLLPLFGIVGTGLCVSLLALRPARALALTLAAVLGPELLRGRLGEHAGWLLSSHLPTGLRDDSVVGWFAAIARGAADANWPWRSEAVLAPLLWSAVPLALAVVCFRRQRVA